MSTHNHYDPNQIDKDPYAEGFDAFKAGKQREANPYLYTLPASTAVDVRLWYKGWDIAETAKKEGIEV